MPGRRDYARTERVNELLREVLADSIERIDDDRLSLVSVTGVEVDRELRTGRVFVDTDLPEALDALADHRARLQSAIARQVRMRRTPMLSFVPDPAILGGRRVEEILRGLHDEHEPGTDA